MFGGKKGGERVLRGDVFFGKENGVCMVCVVCGDFGDGGRGGGRELGAVLGVVEEEDIAFGGVEAISPSKAVLFAEE